MTISPASRTVIATFSHRLDLARPDRADVRIGDIAHSLARINRYLGHTRRAISVAQHSVLVTDLVETPAARPLALLHDAHEAYLGDWPTPVKAALALRDVAARRAFDRLEEAVSGAIFTAIGIPPRQLTVDLWRQVVRADRAALAIEARDHHPSLSVPMPADFVAPAERLRAWGVEEAEAVFLEYARRLLPACGADREDMR